MGIRIFPVFTHTPLPYKTHNNLGLALKDQEPPSSRPSLLPLLPYGRQPTELPVEDSDRLCNSTQKDGEEGGKK